MSPTIFKYTAILLWSIRFVFKYGRQRQTRPQRRAAAIGACGFRASSCYFRSGRGWLSQPKILSILRRKVLRVIIFHRSIDNSYLECWVFCVGRNVKKSSKIDYFSSFYWQFVSEILSILRRRKRESPEIDYFYRFIGTYYPESSNISVLPAAIQKWIIVQIRLSPCPQQLFHRKSLLSFGIKQIFMKKYQRDQIGKSYIFHYILFGKRI